MKAWEDLVGTALLGTRRRTLDPAAQPPAVRHLIAGHGDPAEQLLSAAAVLTSYRRAGRQPLHDVRPLPVAAVDDRPFVPPLARERLGRLLAASHPDLLLEWLGIVAGTAYRVPPETLPLLAEAARTKTALRAPLVAVAGPAGAWLGQRNPDWSFLSAPDGDQADVWQYGSLAQRRRWLAAKLGEDPDGAREALTASWKSEPADVRADFLGVLAGHVRPQDEAFLEAALTDRAAAVREQAADLLGRIPGTRYGQGMAERLRPLVHRRNRVLTVALPQGERGDGTVRLRTLVAAAPLSFWAEFGPPAEVVRMTVEGCPAGVLRDSWATAALRQRDETWAQALIGADPGGRTTPPLLGVLGPAGQAATVGHLIGRLPVESFARLVHELPRPWTKELGTALLDWIARQDDHRLVSHAAVVIARAVPPECLRHPLATTRLTMDAGPWRRALTETLNFRREMYEELA
ncbi:DUF5691 domain-containing protein [Amycolatopsis vancoresmycina]|uniref:Uncharacterized protein n=1 Tax=Amycolatopsis vancoresmycina DSM 44592 TaxID=1292037 RepID=R1ID84_9PSEU|nr:DUF5691 domain-containing protein [Amycolatopsis vancoresmycina]EOD68359.1 hypothetical protein H480_11727 [Amycolatopsis vancoresmycina DSM 44592]